MTDGFRTEHDQLASRAGAFGGLSQRAGRIDGDVRGAVDSFGACWGNDEVGQAFAAGHTGPANATLRDLGQLAGGLTDVGDRLRAAARTYAESDQYGESQLRAAGRDYV